MIIQTYTADMPRPYCPDCGSPIWVPDVIDQSVPWVGSCVNGHTNEYQLEEEELEESYL